MLTTIKRRVHVTFRLAVSAIAKAVWIYVLMLGSISGLSTLDDVGKQPVNWRDIGPLN